MPYVTPQSRIVKAGTIVKRFWHEVVKRNDTHHTTHYNIYLRGTGLQGASLTDDKAPRNLEVAKATARALVEDPNSEWTYAHIWESRCVYRVGTEYDHKATEAMRAKARAQEPENAR